MHIQPYLFFPGCCEEAIEFYRATLGAELQMFMRYKDSPDTPPPGAVPPGYDEKVMHASLKLGESVLMLSDGCNEDPGFAGFSLSLSPADPVEAARLFAALAEGGSVRMPLGPTFWSPAFGMLVDRFGVGWMVNVEGSMEGAQP
ncbi:VOC family protein [Azoarcus sp. L1K30]|uniref:VOC family protein n=1 Tax=Azoarcus sp. L1K30 TaxID=2820277 RepID=UPI001B8134E4|nr:VOC family protein [Azoarcus sp. L1K30]MBR0565739.1 VOC family protein [Azoarcus sp. L1K30]